jgi:hypothetical protein
MVNAKEYIINVKLNPDNLDDVSHEKYRKLLTNNLSRVFEEYLKKRDKYTCQITGAKRNVDIYEFTKNAIYDERNYHMLLNRLGRGYIEHTSIDYMQYMVGAYGWEALDDMAENKKPLLISEILKLTEMYSKKLKELGEVTRW